MTDLSAKKKHELFPKETQGAAAVHRLRNLKKAYVCGVSGGGNKTKGKKETESERKERGVSPCVCAHVR